MSTEPSLEEQNRREPKNISMLLLSNALARFTERSPFGMAIRALSALIIAAIIMERSFGFDVSNASLLLYMVLISLLVYVIISIPPDYMAVLARWVISIFFVLVLVLVLLIIYAIFNSDFCKKAPLFGFFGLRCGEQADACSTAVKEAMTIQDRHGDEAIDLTIRNDLVEKIRIACSTSQPYKVAQVNGYFDFVTHRYDEALMHLKQARTFQMPITEEYSNSSRIGYSLYALGRFTEAEQEFNSLCKSQPSGDSCDSHTISFIATLYDAQPASVSTRCDVPGKEVRQRLIRRIAHSPSRLDRFYRNLELACLTAYCLPSWPMPARSNGNLDDFLGSAREDLHEIGADIKSQREDSNFRIAQNYLSYFTGSGGRRHNELWLNSCPALRGH